VAEQDDLKNQGGQGGAGDAGKGGGSGGTGKEGEGKGGTGGTGGEGGKGGDEQPFLGTYKSKEDAEKGFAEKDSTSGKLQQELAEKGHVAEERDTYRRMLEGFVDKGGDEELSKDQLTELWLEDPEKAYSYMSQRDPEKKKLREEMEGDRQERKEEQVTKVLKDLESKKDYPLLKPTMEKLAQTVAHKAGDPKMAQILYLAAKGAEVEKIAARSKDTENLVTLKEDLEKLSIVTAGTEAGGGKETEPDDFKDLAAKAKGMKESGTF